MKRFKMSQLNGAKLQKAAKYSVEKLPMVVGLRYLDNNDMRVRIVTDIENTYHGDLFKAYIDHPYLQIKSDDKGYYVGEYRGQYPDDKIYENLYAIIFWNHNLDIYNYYIHQMMEQKPSCMNDTKVILKTQAWARTQALKYIAKEMGSDLKIEEVPEPQTSPILDACSAVGAFQNELPQRLSFLYHELYNAKVPGKIVYDYINSIQYGTSVAIAQSTDSFISYIAQNNIVPPDVLQKLAIAFQEGQPQQYYPEQQAKANTATAQQQQAGVNPAVTQMTQQPIQPQQQYTEPQAKVSTSADKQRVATYNKEEEKMTNPFIDYESLQMLKDNDDEIMERFCNILQQDVEKYNETSKTINQSNDIQEQQTAVNQNAASQTQQPATNQNADVVEQQSLAAMRATIDKQQQMENQGVANQKKSKVAYSEDTTQNDYGELNTLLDNSADVLAEFDKDIQAMANSSDTNETNQNAAPAPQYTQTNAQGTAAYNNGYPNSYVPGMTQPQYGMPLYGAGVPAYGMGMPQMNVPAYGQYNVAPQAGQIHMYRGEGNF